MKGDRYFGSPRLSGGPVRLAVPCGLAPLVLALLASQVPAQELSAEYRRLWNDPALQQKIDRNIRAHRLGDATVELVGPGGAPAAGAQVEIEQLGHEFLFGCNAFVLGQLATPEKNRLYEERFARLFNFATVPFYWEGTEPAQGELRYAEGGRDMWRRPPADRYLPFAKRHGLTLKGHPLLWHAYNPPWLPADADALRRLYQKRFSEIASRYAESIQVWDVVNESLVCGKQYPLYTPDRSYVAWAFREAAARFRPGNVLMINEVTEVAHEPGPGNRYWAQIRGLLDQGVRIDGIGFQFHLMSESSYRGVIEGRRLTPQQLYEAYERFSAFGKPLYVTEITVPQSGEAPQGERVQAELVANLYRLWFSVPQMAGITWWNLAEGTAVAKENKHRGGLLDEQLHPKQAYRALEQWICRDWRTRLSGQTDAQGRLAFRGFYGRYRVTVESPHGKRQHEIRLAQGQPHVFRLSVSP